VRGEGSISSSGGEDDVSKGKSSPEPIISPSLGLEPGGGEYDGERGNSMEGRVAECVM
jgi:hypothetical protein